MMVIGSETLNLPLRACSSYVYVPAAFGAVKEYFPSAEVRFSGVSEPLTAAIVASASRGPSIFWPGAASTLYSAAATGFGACAEPAFAEPPAAVAFGSPGALTKSFTS